MTMVVRLCRQVRDLLSERCFSRFPCLSDPVRRSSICMKIALVMLHLVYVGVLFLVDRDLIQKAKNETWYIALYLLLFVATLAQYFFTSGSSPGYVLDAMRIVTERESLLRSAPLTMNQPAASRNRDTIIAVDGNQLGRRLLGSNAMSWSKLVMELYSPGSSTRQWTCTYCGVLQAIVMEISNYCK